MVSRHKRAGKGKSGIGTEVLPTETEREQLAFLFNAGRYAELESLTRQLLVSYPGSGFVWMLLGLSLRAQGRDGLPALRKAAAFSPDDAEIHSNLGNVLWERGGFEAAEASCRRAVQIAPEFAMAHNNLGNALHSLGRLDDALVCFRRALAIMPDYAAAHANIGNTLRDLGQPEAAMASCRRALEIAPDFSLAYLCLGSALQDTKRFAEAEMIYRRALEIKPDFAEAHNNLATILRGFGRLEEAAASARRALECQPNFAEAACNLGLMLWDLEQLAEAEKNYRRALELKPDLPMAWNNLGSLQLDLGQLDEAIMSYRRTLTLTPAYSDAYSNLLFALNYHPDKSAEEVYEAYRDYDERYGLPHRQGGRQHDNLRQPGKRLKIGYVSPDFRHHSCRYFLEPLLSHHDKKEVEVTAYAELMGEDEVTWRYKGYVDHWVVTSGLTDDALAERIRTDGIDILIDLAGHTDKNRLGVFARKPAPVQVSWLGYGYTTGLTAIDYLLTDGVSAPEGSEALFSEQPFRLETPCYAYRPAEGMGEPGPLPAKRKGRVTFGTLTRAIRLNHHVIRAWSEILKRVPESRLLVDSRNYRESGAQENLKAKFAAHGILPERLEIGYHSPPWDVLREIDIGLDCFPHNSGTTLFETLYLGIPYITLAGRPSVGRLGSSILHGLGHSEWIAGSAESYIEKAVELAGDLKKLDELRHGLRGEMTRSALMDEAGFARKVEAAYRRMWERWCSGDEKAQPAGIESGKEKVLEPAKRKGGQKESAGQDSIPDKRIRGRELPQGERERLVGLYGAGRHEEMESHSRRLLESYPDSGLVWKILAYALQSQGKEALEVLRKARELLPEDADIHNNLGNALRDAGQTEEALASYRRALELRPDYAEAYYNLGNALEGMGRYGEAAESHRRALELKPDFVGAHYNLGNNLRRMGEIEAAITSYRHALALQPDFALAWCNLGGGLQEQGLLEEAITNYRRALELDPLLTDAYSNLLFALNYHPDKSAEEVYEAYRDYDERYGLPHRQGGRQHDNLRQPGKRLKIGYVSPDFRHHSCRYFLEPLLSHHDKKEVEVTAYAELMGEDEVTWRYKGYVDHWVVTSGLTDDALAERIRTDGIDILIDLAGHTDKNRLGVFARKPAPVQVSWLGYGYTTGLTAIDYLLTDGVSAPEGSEALFSEQPFRLETPCYAYRPAEGMGEPGPLPAKRKGRVTFGTLTRAIRLNHHVIRAWSEILKRVPESRLLVDSRNYRESGAQENLKAKFAAHGILPERLEIGYHSPPWDVLREIDIGLDCFPHNSGTTLFETLYLGIPYITLAGRPSVGRLGSSILHGLGHSEWIAGSAESYIEKAVELAGDLKKLDELRHGLRGEMTRSALMDEAGFARKVEAAYRRMWERWCSGDEKAQPAGIESGKEKVLEPAKRKGGQKESAGQDSIPDKRIRGRELPQGERERLVGLYGAGRHEEMESHSRRLLESYPDSGLVWKILAYALQSQGKEALEVLRKARELLPEDADIHNNLGNALRDAGQTEEALASYRRALELRPDYAEAYYNLGNALEGMGRYGEAAESHRRALELKPDFVGAHYNLGNNLRRMGEIEAAITSYRHALALQPDFALAWCNLGVAQQELGLLDKAVASYQRAIHLDPGYARAYSHLGAALHGLGRLDEAMASERHALELDPGFAEGWNNLGVALQAAGQMEEAMESLRQALQIDPDYADAWCNLGVAQQAQGQIGNAISSYHHVLKLNPEHAKVYSNLLYTLNYHPDASDEEMLALAHDYDARFGAPCRGMWRPHGNGRDTGRRLKVGYMSPDFRGHAVAFFFEPILANHDRSQVEVYCYAEVPREDDYTERLRRLTDHWHSTVGLSDDAVAEMIRKHQIDILVDLAGHTASSRLRVFARKPSPVQVTYLGYPATTGLAAMDYRITDRYADPEGESEWRYVEKLLRLPDSLWCYRPSPDMPEVSPLPALTSGYLTFGSFNNYNKVDRESIDLWSALLREVPGSRLLMLTVPEGGARRRLLKEFAERGIEEGRLDLHGKLPREAFLRKFHEADIALDPVNVNGGTTTCEALWMGLPVLTLTGKRFLSRAGLSILSTVGMADFAAATQQDYIRVATYLNENRELLPAIRASLRGYVAASPLTDEVNFTRHLENLYREVWRAWCAGDEKAQPAGIESGKEKFPEPAKRKEGEEERAGKGVNRGIELPQGEREYLIGLHGAGCYGEMESHSRRLLESYPDSGFAWKALSAALQIQGKEAMAALLRAAEYLPDDADIHNNLGNALREIGRIDEAAASYRRALEINPKSAEAHNNLGNALNDSGRFDEAIASYRQALAVNPDFAEAYSNLGNALREVGKVDEAVKSCLHALEINPDFAKAHNNFGNAMKELGIFDEAVASYRKALECNPAIADVYSNLLFLLNAIPERHGSEIHSICHEYDRRFKRWDGQAHPNERSPSKRLRIGYVSPDFRRHAVAYFAEPIFANHDRTQVEIYCYAEVSREDDYTERFRGWADHWHSTVGLSDEAVERLIREHRIDILVDLAGHTRGNRLPVFGCKPAPVQLTYLGYAGSTGLSTVDYRLTDRYTDPEGEAESRYIEKLLRLPDSLWCYRPSPDMPEVTPLPALGRGYLTFGSFNNFNKIDRDTLALWAAMLRKIPDSRLMMLTVPEGDGRQRLLREFARLGVEAGRLDLHGPMPMNAFHRQFLEADIALDPINVNGGTTTCEALWMGLPVISLTGKHFLSRAGLSILNTVGMADFTVATAEDYIRVASYLDGERELLAELRAGLRGHVAASPLTDEAKFTRSLEGIFRDVWRKWCESL